MALKAESQTSTALAATLPARVHTRSGTSIDPSSSTWTLIQGTIKAQLDFTRFVGGYESFVPSLKLALIPYVKGHSCSHVSNLFQAFAHFVDSPRPAPLSVITPQDVSNYSARLSDNNKWRVGTLNGLLQKWVALNLPGVDPECAEYLQRRRKPGNKKGEAVRTNDPVDGPLTEEEYKALYLAVNTAYGEGRLPLWTLLLTRLLLACGGRISQYASLKMRDFDRSSLVLNLPRAKTGEMHGRVSFIDFDLSPQTGQLLGGYIEDMCRSGFDANSALFPAKVVMKLGPRSQQPDEGGEFDGHCLSATLSRAFRDHLYEFAPPTSRLDYSPLPVAPKRFRYTFGTRLVEEGASVAVVANRLGHVDLQNAHVYFAASPRIVKRIDETMGPLLAPLAGAFKGRLVDGPHDSTNKGAPGSRIIDFRVSSDPVGECEKKAKGCGFQKPIACYTCFRFEPWVDGPHEKVLTLLEAERGQWSSDERLAAINDDAIRGVREVISHCEQAMREREDVARGKQA